MTRHTNDQPSLPFRYERHGAAGPPGFSGVFDPARLTQARQLAGLTKKELAEAVGVTPAAIGQYEAGTNGVRPSLISRLAEVLDFPIEFFAAGRPHGKLDASMVHFKSLRSTRNYQRDKAKSFAEQVWELAYVIERYVVLPPVDLPGFISEAAYPSEPLSRIPQEAARELRQHWDLGTGPISHLVRHIEARGVVTVFSGSDPDSTTVDAYSTSRLSRPVIVLTTNRADDVYWHRFSAAHELGHLIIHDDIAPGDPQQEREADAFAAEFLTPEDSIAPELPQRVDFARLLTLQRAWGVSIKSLIRRSRELGLISESSATRAYQRLNVVRDQPGYRGEPVIRYLGEQPAMLSQAFDVALSEGLTMAKLTEELKWHAPRVRRFLGTVDQRPNLQLVVNNS